MEIKGSVFNRVILGAVEIILAAIALYLMLFTINELSDNVIADYIKNQVKYVTSDSIAVNKLADEDKVTIERLINSGVILTSNDLLERSIEFYTNVISALVFTVSVFSIVSLVYIKASVEDKNSNQIRSAVLSYFETDKNHYLKTLETVKTEFEEWTDTYELDIIEQKTNTVVDELNTMREDLNVMIAKFEQLRANVDVHIKSHGDDTKEVVPDTEVNLKMVSD